MYIYNWTGENVNNIHTDLRGSRTNTLSMTTLQIKNIHTSGSLSDFKNSSHLHTKCNLQPRQKILVEAPTMGLESERRSRKLSRKP